jgi:hypothetical protein
MATHFWHPSTVSFRLFLATAALAPLPFGSVEPFVSAVAGLVMLVALITAPLSAMRPNPRRLLRSALAVAVLYLALFAFQLWPDPPFGLAHSLWQRTAAETGTETVARISVAPGETLYVAGNFLVLVAIFALGVIHGQDSRNAQTLLRVLATAGLVYALFAIAQFTLMPDYLMWHPKFAYFESLTAPFVNRNTAATYYGTVAILWGALIVIDRRARRAAGHEGGGEQRLYLQISAIAIVLIALFMTNSRAGTIASLLGGLTFAIFAVSFRSRSFMWRLFAVLAVLAATVATIWLLGDTIALRLTDGPSSFARLCAYRTVHAAIAEHFWFGTGLGSFELAFPAFRDPECGITGTWDRAHNTLLNLTFELGVPAGALALFLWLKSGQLLALGFARRRSGRIYPLTALAVWVCAGVHSLIDFSLEIPGYAAVVAAILGTALAQSVMTRDDPLAAPIRSAGRVIDT